MANKTQVGNKSVSSAHKPQDKLDKVSEVENFKLLKFRDDDKNYVVGKEMEDAAIRTMATLGRGVRKIEEEGGASVGFSN